MEFFYNFFASFVVKKSVPAVSRKYFIFTVRNLYLSQRLNNIYEISPYFKVNTKLRHYKDQLVNAV
jgi:hypothetical protein